MNPQSLQSWQALFVASGFAASGVIFIYLYRKWVFNRLLLGLNLYLISGGLALMLKQAWLYHTYEMFQASGMLLWIVITGIFSIILTPRGFIGIHSPDTKTVRMFSVYLLICSLIAFALSYNFRGHALLSEQIPFFFLFMFQGLLRQKLKKKRPQTD